MVLGRDLPSHPLVIRIAQLSGVGLPQSKTEGLPMTNLISRRNLIASSVTLPLLPAVAKTARADGHAAPVEARRIRSLQMGDMRITPLLDATGTQDNPQGIFGMNVSPEDFAAASDAAFIPADRFQSYVTPILVQTGTETILFDTGLGNGGIDLALAEAGVASADITHVVLTHMHPDHIGGVLLGNVPRFENAAYVTGRVEYEFWTGPGADNRLGQMVAGAVAPQAERMTFLDDGGAVASGITAVAAFGHTPGHMAYRLESGGQQMILAADLANHYVWSLAYPDWEVRFDADKEAAAASRRRILDMVATDRIAMAGYHLPFPGVGFVETRGDGFHWVPMSYQFG